MESRRLADGFAALDGREGLVDAEAVIGAGELGGVLEREVEVQAVVQWKNLKTGELMIDHKSVAASASYSEYQLQDFKYGSTVAANNLARKIVELMERSW